MHSLSARLQRIPPGRHMLPRELVALNQRARILIAAAELIAENGYPATTVEQIIKLARVSWTTFSAQFADKEDCLLTIFDQAADDLSERLDQALAAESLDWPDQVRIALATIAGAIADDPITARVCLNEMQPAGARAQARSDAALQRFVPKLYEGRQFNPRRHWPQRLEESIVGGLAWLAQRRLASGDSEGIEDLLPEMVQIALAPYVGEEEADRIALQS